MSQLSLLSPPPPVPAPEICGLTVEPVPARLALGPGRYYLVAVQGQLRWAYPIQWSLLECWHLLKVVERLDWSLSSEGVPVFAEEIHLAAERFVDGVGGCRG